MANEPIDFKKTLWEAACKLLPELDAAVYKHVALGLIFLKYIADSFDERREELKGWMSDPENDYFVEDESAREEELEDRDYYIAANVFWVPAESRWNYIQDNAKKPGIGKLIDDAMAAIERENPRLKGILNKDYARLQISERKLGELVDLTGTIGFMEKGHRAKDILGQVYEYFLGQFASAEGKKGGQFYTPASIVKVLVEVMSPHKGKIYDPACGSGGMFVQSEKFIEAHGGTLGDISIYGQESNPTTWRLAAMNLAIRGIDFNLGPHHADTFYQDLHPDLKADFIMANPPFNMKEWGGDKLAGDVRWRYGIPAGNANFAWMQHIIHHLSPSGMAGIVLANGSMSSNSGGEGDIRRAMVQDDLVECMVALPSQLFSNTQIPACLWFLTRDKTKNGRNRKGEVLFIDARKLGFMVDRAQRAFADEDIARIAETFHAWRGSGETDKAYEDVKGFCSSMRLSEIEKYDFVLTPGRYVGAEDIEDDGEAFEDKMGRLSATLAEQFTESSRLEELIRTNLKGLGYDA